MDDPAAVVRSEGLIVRHGEVRALDGLSMSAPAAAITAVLGPNGAGKTTLLRCIATLQDYSAGSLVVAGSVVRDRPAEVRRSIGFAGQFPALTGKLTGRENLILTARLHGQDGRRADRAVSDVINALELGGFVGQRVEICSGGQRRRLDLAAALVGTPPLVLLDEPTTGVDPRGRSELWQLISELPRRGTSVMLTTQYLEEAAALADHVVIVDHGRAIGAGSVDAIRRMGGSTSLIVDSRTSADPYARQQIAAAIGAEVHVDGQRLTAVGTFSFAAAARALTSTGIDPVEMAYRPPTLDEVFLAMTEASADPVGRP